MLRFIVTSVLSCVSVVCIAQISPSVLNNAYTHTANVGRAEAESALDSGAFSVGCSAKFIFVIVGNNNDTSRGIEFSDLFGCREPVHAWHAYVHQNEIGTAIYVGTYSINAIRTLVDIGRQMADHAAQEIADPCIVFDNQNLHF